MRKDKKELLRLQSMIENDRISVGDNFLQLIKTDMINLLRDYFDFSNPPQLSLQRQNNSYFFSLNLNVSRVKQFASANVEMLEKY